MLWPKARSFLIGALTSASLAASVTAAFGALAPTHPPPGEIFPKNQRSTNLSLSRVTLPPLSAVSRHYTWLENAARRLRAMHAQAQYLAEKYQRPLEKTSAIVRLAWREAKPHEGIRPELVLGIIEKESSLRARASNDYGAQGLMQVVARLHKDRLDPGESLLDPHVNIRVGVEVLQEFMRKKNGDLTLALTGYSGGAKGYASQVFTNARELALVAWASRQAG